MSAMNELIDGMAQGREWGAMGDGDAVRTLLGRVYDERYHSAVYHKDRFQLRVNLQKTAPELESVSGRYFEKCREKVPSELAQDEALAKELLAKAEARLAR